MYTSYSKAKHSFLSYVLLVCCMHILPYKLEPPRLASLQVAWNTVQTLVLLRSFIPMLHHQQTILWNWSLTMLWPTNLQWIIVGLVFGHHNILWEDQDSLLPQKPVIPGVSHPKSCEFFFCSRLSQPWGEGMEPEIKGDSRAQIFVNLFSFENLT